MQNCWVLHVAGRCQSSSVEMREGRGGFDTLTSLARTTFLLPSNDRAPSHCQSRDILPHDLRF